MKRFLVLVLLLCVVLSGTLFIVHAREYAPTDLQPLMCFNDADSVWLPEKLQFPQVVRKLYQLKGTVSWIRDYRYPDKQVNKGVEWGNKFDRNPTYKRIVLLLTLYRGQQRIGFVQFRIDPTHPQDVYAYATHISSPPPNAEDGYHEYSCDQVIISSEEFIDLLLLLEG